MKSINRLFAAAGLGFVSMASQAATDTTAITGAITDAATACGVVGAAVLVLHYGVKVYKWIKTAG